jgi:hypothetical protein
LANNMSSKILLPEDGATASRPVWRRVWAGVTQGAIERLGPVKIKEVEQSQQQIIGLVRQLESEGVLNLKGAVGEQYVV